MTRARLSLARAYRLLEDPGSGGVVLFVGRVRSDRRAKGSVRALLYEADEAMATGRLEQLAGRARSRFGARRVVVWHRVGELPVGEISVLVGVAAAHRADAFAAARHLIDSVKREAAIWKLDRLGPSSAPARKARRSRRRRRPVK